MHFHKPYEHIPQHESGGQTLQTSPVPPYMSTSLGSWFPIKQSKQKSIQPELMWDELHNTELQNVYQRKLLHQQKVAVQQKQLSNFTKAEMELNTSKFK